MKVFRAGLVVAAFAATTSAHAQVFSLNRAGSGARAAGMGNAFIAISDDGTAVSWNPAGLSQLRKPEFSIVQAASRRSQLVDGYRTMDHSSVFTSFNTTSTAANIEFASAALPLSLSGRPVTVQLGWRRLYQFGSRMLGDTRRIPVSPSGRPESTIHMDQVSDGSVNLWSVAGAVRLTSRLSLGVSTDFYNGAWEDRANNSEDPGVLGPTDFVSSRITNQIGGHSYNLGLLLAYPSVKVGVVYHGSLRTGFEVTQSNRSNFAAATSETFGPEDGVRLLFPRSIGVGVAWLPKPLLRLALDLTYDEWTKFLVETGDGSTKRRLSGFDNLPPDLTATRNTVTLNAGFERLVPLQGRYLPIRLGFSHEPQGGRDPIIRESADQTVVAGGTGINSNSVKFDVALEYRWGSYHNTTNISPVYSAGRAEALHLPSAPEAEGTTRFQEWRLKVSMIIRVIDVEKFKDVLRKAVGS